MSSHCCFLLFLPFLLPVLPALNKLCHCCLLLRYEPWVIADRFNVPMHDVRFRGYGNNKIQQIAHTNSSGFKFVVLPTAFIIHRCAQTSLGAPLLSKILGGH